MTDGQDVVKRAHAVLTRAYTALSDLAGEASGAGDVDDFTQVKAALDAVEVAHRRMSRYRAGS